MDFYIDVQRNKGNHASIVDKMVTSYGEYGEGGEEKSCVIDDIVNDGIIVIKKNVQTIDPFNQSVSLIIW